METAWFRPTLVDVRVNTSDLVTVASTTGQDMLARARAIDRAAIQPDEAAPAQQSLIQPEGHGPRAVVSRYAR